MDGMKDYKGTGCPEPEDRRIASDFPPVDELYTYGEDFPAPTSMGELRGNYNEDDRNPLELGDLEGYCVPPLGLKTIGVNGSGFQPRGGWIYPPGTFRENKYTIDKELGVTHKEITTAREVAKKNAIVTGVVEAIEELGLAALDNIKDKDAQVIGELFKQVIIMAVESKNPRELLNATKYIDKRLADKDEAIIRNREGTKMSPEEVRKWIDLYREAREEGLGPIIEGEFEE